MSNADTLNLSWTKVKPCHRKRQRLMFFSGRQPPDPDHIAEHWRPTPDPHRLADAAQASSLNTDNSAVGTNITNKTSFWLTSSFLEMQQNPMTVDQEQRGLLCQTLGASDSCGHYRAGIAEPLDLWRYSSKLTR